MKTITAAYTKFLTVPAAYGLPPISVSGVGWSFMGCRLGLVWRR